MSANTNHPYTFDRLQDDWLWYYPVLEQYTWFIDTEAASVLHTAEHEQSPTNIALSVAPQTTPTDSSHVTPQQITHRDVGTVADFAGMIETGELIPVAVGETVAVKTGVLSVTDTSVSYAPVNIPDGAPLLNKHHAEASQVRPQCRPDIGLQDVFGECACSFINPVSVTQTVTSPSATPADGGLIDPAQESPIDPRDEFDSVSNPISVDSLLAGDAVDGLQRVQTESVQLACFSPPYNIGKLYGEYEDDVPIERWYAMMRSVFDELFRVLEPDGKIVLNIGKSFGDSDIDGRFFFYPIEAYVKQLAIEAGFDFWDEAIWMKRGFNGRGGGALMGSYPDPTNMMITQTHEHVLVFRKWVSEDYHNSRELPDVGSETRMKSKLTKDRWRTLTQSNWEIDTVRQSSLDVDHSAVYPEELPKRAVQLYSFKGDTVIDPFCGTGTTCVAAKQAGRRYIGIDNNPEYVTYAKQCVDDVEFNDPNYISQRDVD